MQYDEHVQAWRLNRLIEQPDHHVWAWRTQRMYLRGLMIGMVELGLAGPQYREIRPEDFFAFPHGR